MEKATFALQVLRHYLSLIPLQYMIIRFAIFVYLRILNMLYESLLVNIILISLDYLNTEACLKDLQNCLGSVCYIQIASL